jgi:hypothetical protein
MLRVLLVSAALLPILGGCAITNQQMANDKGQTVKCSTFGAGVIGTLVAVTMEKKCIDDYQKQGFHEVPNTPPPAASPASTSSASTPTDQQTTK